MIERFFLFLLHERRFGSARGGTFAEILDRTMIEGCFLCSCYQRPVGSAFGGSTATHLFD